MLVWASDRVPGLHILFCLGIVVGLIGLAALLPPENSVPAAFVPSVLFGVLSLACFVLNRIFFWAEPLSQIGPIACGCALDLVERFPMARAHRDAAVGQGRQITRLDLEVMGGFSIEQDAADELVRLDTARAAWGDGDRAVAADERFKRLQSRFNRVHLALWGVLIAVAVVGAIMPPAPDSIGILKFIALMMSLIGIYRHLIVGKDRLDAQQPVWRSKDDIHRCDKIKAGSFNGLATVGGEHLFGVLASKGAVLRRDVWEAERLDREATSPCRRLHDVPPLSAQPI